MIYYLEDDPHILDLAVYTLETAGLEAQGFSNAKDFFAACRRQVPDVALLDIMLPDMDGIEVLKRLRADRATQHLPIMMLTAKGSEIDKVVGLNAGADDYLAKPFGMMEFVARVKALLRRTEMPALVKDEITCGPITLSEAAHRAAVNDIDLTLTPKEFDLLHLLIAHCGIVLSRSRLLEEVWGMSFLGESRTVDVHVLTLRQKLEAALEGTGSLIETVRGVGYRMRDLS